MKANTNHGKSIVSGKILLKTNKQQEGGEKILLIMEKNRKTIKQRGRLLVAYEKRKIKKSREVTISLQI